MTYLDQIGVYKADVVNDGASIWETKIHFDPTIVISQAWVKLHELAHERSLEQKRSEKALRMVLDTLEAHGI